MQAAMKRCGPWELMAFRATVASLGIVAWSVYGMNALATDAPAPNSNDGAMGQQASSFVRIP
jgi:hypothetical protein